MLHYKLHNIFAKTQIIFFYQNTENFCSDMSRKRVSLSAAQKRELCETKEKNPDLSNVELAVNIMLESQQLLTF